MIQINLLRISPDSQYLEFSVECPLNYKFNKLYIKKYDYVPNTLPVDSFGNPTDDGWRDCSNLLQGTTTKEIMRISTIALSKEFNNGIALPIEPNIAGQSASTMYYVQFGTTYSLIADTYDPEVTYASADVVTYDLKTYKSNQPNNIGKSLTDTAWWSILPTLVDVIGVASDVNAVYTILKDDLLNLDTNCLNQDNYQKLLRNYMFLYGHIEAMKLERFDEAEMFYDIIKKEFVSCSTSRLDNKRIINSCNCN